MESLVESFETRVHVTLDENDTSLVHPRYKQYKHKTPKSTQEERRRNWLQSQKEKRRDSLNAGRDLDDAAHSENKNAEKKLKKVYKHTLMMSEWLVDVPNDLESDWIVKPCPEGRRVLVVAERGRTTAYGRNGHPVMSFASLLPGGARGSSARTLLDCVWSPLTKVFYVLDAVYWGCLLTHCEAEFRFFWTRNKLRESPEVTEASRRNEYRLEEVGGAGWSEVAGRMTAFPYFEGDRPRLDGLLFYHREGHYAPGRRTPLVGWLKPFMLPHLLNRPVSEHYLRDLPPHYQKMDVGEGCGDSAPAEEEKTEDCEEMC